MVFDANERMVSGMVINNFVSEFVNRILFTDYSNTLFRYTIMLFSDSKVSKLVGENLWELWQTSWTSLLCGLRLLAQVASQQLIIAARQKSEQEIASHDSFSEMKLLFGKFDKRCLLNNVHERFLLRLFEQIEFFSEQFSLYCVNQSIRKLKRSLPEGDPFTSESITNGRLAELLRRRFFDLIDSKFEFQTFRIQNSAKRQWNRTLETFVNFYKRAVLIVFEEDD